MSSGILLSVFRAIKRKISSVLELFKSETAAYLMFFVTTFSGKNLAVYIEVMARKTFEICLKLFAMD